MVDHSLIEILDKRWKIQPKLTGIGIFFLLSFHSAIHPSFLLPVQPSGSSAGLKAGCEYSDKVSYYLGYSTNALTLSQLLN